MSCCETRTNLIGRDDLHCRCWKNDLNYSYLKYCQKKDIENVRNALSLGVNVNCRTRILWGGMIHREGALHFCVRNNSEELLNIILSHPRVNVNIMDNNGRTPLMIACLTQKVKIMRILCQMTEIDPNIRDCSGCTALYFAINRKNIECLKILRTLPNVDWNMSCWQSRHYYGNSPLMQCLKSDEEGQVTRYLINNQEVDLNSMDWEMMELEEIDMKKKRDVFEFRAPKLRCFYTDVTWDESYAEDVAMEKKKRDIFELLADFSGPKFRMIHKYSFFSRKFGMVMSLQSLSRDVVLVTLICNNKKQRKVENLVDRIGGEEITRPARKILLELEANHFEVLKEMVQKVKEKIKEIQIESWRRR